jgi:choline monooxygenase
VQWYTDAAIFERERTQIFGRTWQWVGRLDQVSTPGMYFTCEVAGEPLVVVRGTDGELRALSNVCRHKAAPVAQGCGTARRFQCGYHGWTYGLDGALLGTPHFSEGEGFRRADNGLPSARVATWGPLVFVNLDPAAPPLDTTVRRLADRFERYRLDELTFFRRVTFEAACNWKVFEENGRECYHCATVHPSFREAYRIEDVREETLGLCSVMFVPERDAARAPDGEEDEAPATDIVGFRRELTQQQLSGDERNGNFLAFLFPNFMLSLAPDNVFAQTRTPITVDRLRYMRDYFVWPSAHATDDLERNWDFRMRTIQEDVGICEQVQQGLRSRSFTHGWYSRKESLVHQFHALMRQYLGDEP